MAASGVHRPLRMLRLCIALAGVLAPPPSAIAAEPAVHRVLIEKFAFLPRRLEIRSGDKVEWVNRDVAPHTATAGDRSWDTDSLTRGQSAGIIFGVPGTFDYRCRHHPHMRAEIIVVEAGE